MILSFIDLLKIIKVELNSVSFYSINYISHIMVKFTITIIINIIKEALFIILMDSISSMVIFG
jgi:hypothetical protein